MINIILKKKLNVYFQLVISWICRKVQLIIEDYVEVYDLFVEFWDVFRVDYMDFGFYKYF